MYREIRPLVVSIVSSTWLSYVVPEAGALLIENARLPHKFGSLLELPTESVAAAVAVICTATDVDMSDKVIVFKLVVEHG